MILSWVIAAYAVAGSFMVFRYRLRHYLRYFQQEEYDGKRFLLWVGECNAFDKKTLVVALLAMALTSFVPYHLVITAIAATMLAVTAFSGEDPTTSGKKTLIMTPRAIRIYRLSVVLYSTAIVVGATAALALGRHGAFPVLWFLVLLLSQSVPLWLLLATKLLSPGEKRRQRKYSLEAKRILADVDPYVVGITGSYGKTSTKHILGEMLQTTLGTTFWPDKGVNTVMGITREIREKLSPGTEYAVIEMGAYHQGSIQKLCDFTPPQAAIITAVGICHLERFGSEEAIYRGKEELAKAVPDDGIIVCNGDDTGARNIAKGNPKMTTLLYGFDNSKEDLDCWMSSYAVVDSGMTFTIDWKGKEYQGSAPFFGTTALSNGMAAFAMACALGADAEFALGVLCSHEPVDNRLQVKKSGGVTYVNDAYNSNPVGFAAALDVAKALPAKKRIIMTPGMIELGDRQEAENNKAARKAGSFCDYAIVVGETNRKSIAKGLRDGGMPEENIFLCNSRDDAFHNLAIVADDGDAVLIENDLPDLYETKVRF
ncbi:MAG: UDP-N-acetylmuramoyl-tripeptide--D-alanyl-D-alanine ligase [Waddliaceae bacterium]|nr:UDP-N-acetylmuramoyl-tripeptide--D-alanyl-D-alanine ligase [Waddliaceae bacterium]MBT7264468.1 UDP-N-acetylmuramoyl-tripeptide--D-alanyl-D-alanine ligase [Waddliaceae bacterium]